VPKFSIKDRLLSFKNAFDGLKVLLKAEHSAWIQVGLALVATALGFYFEISSSEWIIIVLCIGMVISAEIFNTAIEYIADFIQPNLDERIKHIKDLGAAGVFMTALATLIAGLIIFLPKIMALF
jgi:diacylglycerol kinase